MAQNGNLLVGNVIRKIQFLSLFCISLSSYAQKNSVLPLHDALLGLAKSAGKSIIYNPDNVKNIDVSLPDNTASLSDRLTSILHNTGLEYKLDEHQIFLYKIHKIYGYLEDGETGERLIAAAVYLPNNGDYDISNNYGQFTLETIEDSIQIEGSYLGYASLTKMIKQADMDRPITLKLYPDNTIPDIIVSDALYTSDEKKYIDQDNGSDIQLFQNQASSAIGGEPDIFQAMIRQTGVNAGTDGVGGIHVRGGRNDQNLILYDGITLYNSAHAFGIYSNVNNSIIDQAKFYKSGVNGPISGRLSSILDIKTKDPNLLKFKSSVQVSTLASQAAIEVPIIKNKLGISLAGRRTHIDPIIKQKSERDKRKYGETGGLKYHFDDLNLKLFGKLSQRSRLFLSLYQANDNYRDESDYVDDYFDDYTYDEAISYKWTNRLGALRLNHIFTSKTFLNFQISSYQYDYDNKHEFNSADPETPHYERYFQKFTTGITSHEARLDFESIWSHHSLKYGINSSIKNYEVGDFTYEEELEDETIPVPQNLPLFNISIGQYKALSNTAYLSTKSRFRSNIILESGVYFNRFSTSDLIYDELTTYSNIFGYLKSNFKIGNNSYIGASVNKSVQPEHLLTTGDSGYPSDIWVPSTSIVAPQESTQFEIFGTSGSSIHKVAWSAFFKRQKNIVYYDTIAALPSVTILESDQWEDETIRGDAEGFGIEFNYTLTIKDKFILRTGYTYNQTFYSFEYIDIGKKFPFDYSIPHTISIGSNIPITDHINLTIDWYYATGKPYTLYESEVPYSPLERLSNVGVYQISNYNEQRLPASHKLSIACSFVWNWSSVRNDLYLGVQNVYNRKNVLYSYELSGEGLKNQTGFPILPMFRWKVSI